MRSSFLFSVVPLSLTPHSPSVQLEPSLSLVFLASKVGSGGDGGNEPLPKKSRGDAPLLLRLNP